MGRCKLECPDGKTECCIYCEKQDSCQCRCDDVDKVIEQLEKEESKARLELMEDRKTAFEFSSKCRLEAYKKALEIVKGEVE